MIGPTSIGSFDRAISSRILSVRWANNHRKTEDTVYNIEVVYGEQLEVNLKAKDWLKDANFDKGKLGKKSGKGFFDG